MGRLDQAMISLEQKPPLQQDAARQFMFGNSVKNLPYIRAWQKELDLVQLLLGWWDLCFEAAI